MTRNSEIGTELVALLGGAAHRKLSPLQLRLRIAAAVLLLLNLAALYLYLSPPGGSRADLQLESVQVRTQILAAQTQAAKMRSLAANVQAGSGEAADFTTKYFLPKRAASVAVLEEIQRMAKASGIQERDAAWSEEPIEGTADLTLLNITANYEGANADLMKFLYEADHSPMLLILDALTAAPQRNNQINTAIRFQAIVREAAMPEGLKPESLRQ
jgi:Tfp pilus assembly protein PilO